MKIAYTRPLEYFSPSSLMDFEEDPLRFYCQRLGPKEDRAEREPQGMAQAVGIAFDVTIKSMWENSKPDYSDIDEENEAAIHTGEELAKFYFWSGAGQASVAEGKLIGCELDITQNIPGTDIPVRGKIDLAIESPWIGWTAIDWKVTGGGTPESQRSPNKGYYRRFTKQGPHETKWRHKLWDSPMEELNEKWAMQLATYDWLLGGGMERAAVGIDQVVISRGEPTFVQYRTWVSAKFKEQLRERYRKAWDAVQNEEVVDPKLLGDPDFMRSLI